jgi:hypothetical protein
VLSQTKTEREYRIKTDTIAENACVFINQSGFLEDKTRVKWFREESNDGTTIEAKFSQSGNDFSIEFSEEGELLDVEIEIPKDEIPEGTLKKIEQHLEEEFSKWKIKRVQRQWVGAEADVINSIKQKSVQEGVEENFELIVKGRSKDAKSYFEFLFDASGKMLRKERIVESASDILIY